jgi:hypothetical protein
MFYTPFKVTEFGALFSISAFINKTLCYKYTRLIRDCYVFNTAQHYQRKFSASARCISDAHIICRNYEFFTKHIYFDIFFTLLKIHDSEQISFVQNYLRFYFIHQNDVRILSIVSAVCYTILYRPCSLLAFEGIWRYCSSRPFKYLSL